VTTPRAFLALALVLALPGCGALPNLTVQLPAAKAAVAGEPSASWLGGVERAALERALRRYLERTTPDGRLEVTHVAIEQKLFGARYGFRAVKRVEKLRKTVVHKLTGVYDKREDRIVELREVLVVDPREVALLEADGTGEPAAAAEPAVAAEPQP